MEIDYGDGSDRIWRAAFREGYRRRPRPGELGNYKYWHWVSRNHGFDVAGDWRDWPTKPIPPDAVVPEPPRVETARTLAPEPEQQQQVAPPEPPEPVPPEPESLPVPASPAAGNGRPRAKERAEAFVREQLANGPRYGELVKRDAAE
jgi:hypothetical protein